MIADHKFGCAAITYRATLAKGRDVELHLVMPPQLATLADAFARLNVCYRNVDPRSIEIEIRSRPA